jgi:hypothetical protein
VILRVLFCCALCLAATIGLYSVRPPAALGPDAPAWQFSAERAMAHLPHFASVPHPSGSRENEKARAYLVATLRGLGLTVDVEEANKHGATLKNIVATLPGTANRRAVMLVAHYDSAPAAPGAADDGAGVVSILETIRAIRAGPPLANDLFVLFTDGEEMGLLGAAAYVERHPDFGQRVGVVVNLEARGSSGPALMFETSEQNGWLIQQFARAEPWPTASSLMYSVYRLMPNKTDLTEFKKSGVGGLNFAFTETVRDYHTAGDNIAHLDPRSVQHMGDNTLALARHFGALPLTNTRAPDCIYFNWIGRSLLVYPIWVGWILLAVTFALLLLAFRSGREKLRVSVLGLCSFFLILIVISGGMLLGGRVLQSVLGRRSCVGDTTRNLICFAGLVALGLLIGITALRWIGGKVSTGNLFGGMVFAVAVLAALVLILLPGASYVLQVPAMLGATSLLLASRANTAAGRAGWGLLAALPVLILFAPLAYLFFVNLGLNFASLGATALLLSLLLASAWPLFDFLLRPEEKA